MQEAYGPVPDGSGFAYDVARQDLADQLARIEALDTKTGIFLAAGGAFAGFLFGADSLLREAPPTVFVAVAALVIAALLLSLLAFGNRHYRTAPTPQAAVRLMAAPEQWLRWRFLGNLMEAIEINHTKIERKARLLSAAILCLFLAVMVAGASLVTTIVTSKT